MNEEKNGIKGYIGASAIAELTYVVILNLIHNKNIDIYILNMPSEELSAYFVYSASFPSPVTVPAFHSFISATEKIR